MRIVLTLEECLDHYHDLSAYVARRAGGPIKHLSETRDPRTGGYIFEVELLQPAAPAPISFGKPTVYLTNHV